ncbi:MAG: hypothetical protein LQ340_005189 [Diploschistes diacapsis]|nr:MAG: hypothetical protein LQ340_005189 [Diploschistes diacapsis]
MVAILKLAMWTLGLAAVGGYYGMSGGEKKKEQGPPINATSPDEEKFIKCVGIHRTIEYGSDKGAESKQTLRGGTGPK